MSATRNVRRSLYGIVTSNRMDKTIAVLVARQKQHAKYGKFIKRHSKYLAHDEQSEAGVGDRVEITECRPLSKRKRWRLVRVLETAEIPEIPGGGA